MIDTQLDEIISKAVAKGFAKPIHLHTCESCEQEYQCPCETPGANIPRFCSPLHLWRGKKK